MPDLKFVPIEDLIKEIQSRTICMVLAYQTFEDKDRSNLNSFYGNGTWGKAIALSSMLNNDVLNNWNGELKTLQRISQDENEKD